MSSVDSHRRGSDAIAIFRKVPLICLCALALNVLFPLRTEEKALSMQSTSKPRGIALIIASGFSVVDQGKSNSEDGRSQSYDMFRTFDTWTLRQGSRLFGPASAYALISGS